MCQNKTVWKRVSLWTALLVFGNILLSISINPTDVAIVQILGGWFIALIVAIFFALTLTGDIKFTLLEFILVWIIFTLALYSTYPYNEKHSSEPPIM